MKSFFNSCHTQRWFVTESSFLKRYAEFWMNNERLFPSISRSFSSLLPSVLLFPPSGHRHATSRFNELEMTWHCHVGNLLSEARCSTIFVFLCAPRIRTRYWFSFFPIFPARRHHAVTDDVPRTEFFAVVVSRPSGCVRSLRKYLLSPRIRYHYLRNMNDKKSSYNNILVTRNRCRMT